MKKGEVAEVTIDPEFGFGADGNASLGVPPNATLLYKVEVDSFVKDKESYDYKEPKDKLEGCEVKRVEGNELFKANKLERAVKRYGKALKLIEYDSSFSSDEKKQSKTAKVAIYNNLALCHAKLKNNAEVIKNTGKALENDSLNVKALFRFVYIL